ncbi:ATP-binding protein [Hydrogenophaga pseudoflava]|uniref:ATP-binding protein n=1 Tax=Hydrogenophaga pseudoflava TaxID=47421 RepID=UPI0027E50A14|nr:DUF499 domain-containing protein [Hydrogenophaga pseudoflava]MDQ7746905.1 DUF499 domain-containing protein [Hydrogenophaga pseudoflava]
MTTIYQVCQPRPDLITGSFNPEVFTASLSAVLEHYQGGAAAASAVYTDPKTFFGQATYPTNGMRQVLGDVYRRLSGDLSAPAVHRLETGFGGGKTHTLIGLTHIGKHGTALAGVTTALLDDKLLPAPGSVIVVGIVGDELPVQAVKGAKVQPYTLWGEMAYQVGGEALYKSLQDEVTSFSAPGKEFMKAVFAGNKVLVMLDEMAQYATRLEAARANGAEQLQAFLMTLLNYAQTNEGLSVVITLSGSTDAFSRQAKSLKDVVGKVMGKEVTEAEAVALAEKAAEGTNSVVARAATTVVPVAASELSRLLARRLFTSIDTAKAAEVAKEFGQAYKASSSYLPAHAQGNDYVERIQNFYPFHPTFIEFLNQKLASVENFQGTRGVLRMLSLVIRNLWEKQRPLSIVQTGDIDLKDERILNELLGRTGTGELQVVVNTDVGGPGSSEMEAGYSRAELCDRANPHPAGIPMHVVVWRAVFLHSLAGRAEGLASNLFGINQQEAQLTCVMPEMSGPQVEMALKALKDEAFYLRERDGRYYASLDPSVNRALGSIRNGVTDALAQEYVSGIVRSAIKDGAGVFRIVHDVFEPGHVEDKPGQPQLAVVALGTSSVDVERMVTEAAAGPRRNQNLLLLLLPQTCKAVQDGPWNEDKTQRTAQAFEKLLGIAKQVIAMRRLAEQPGAYGLTEKHLEADNFRAQRAEREKALETETVRLYDTLWYPSASGNLARKEVRTSSGESGIAVVQKVREVLRSDGELVTQDDALTQEKLLQLNKLFFDAVDALQVKTVRDNFNQRRNWPMLERADLLDRILRQGAVQGYWCVYRLQDNNDKPDKFFAREQGGVPMDVNLEEAGWGIVTEPGAKKRDWMAGSISPAKVKDWTREAVINQGAAKVADVVTVITTQHGNVPQNLVLDALHTLASEEAIAYYVGEPEQNYKPELKSGGNTLLDQVTPEHSIITRAKAAERGWLTAAAKPGFRVEADQSRTKLLPLLKRMGNVYTSEGGKSKVDYLDVFDLVLPDGGTVRLQLNDVSAADMKALQELFEVLMSVAKVGPNTAAELEVKGPVADCGLIKKLKGA